MKSSRIGFDYWSESDLPLARALWGDARVTALLGGPFAEEQIRQMMEGHMASQAAYQVQYWPIFLLDGDQHAGCAGLRPYRIKERIFELGFHLRPEFWGRGLAVEAGRAVIALGFDSLAASALFAGHHPENLASRRVLGKLGFQFTGEEFYPPTGLNNPSYLLDRSRVREDRLPRGGT